MTNKKEPKKNYKILYISISLKTCILTYLHNDCGGDFWQSIVCGVYSY